MGQLMDTSLQDVAGRDRLSKWYTQQVNADKPIYYLLPSMRWFHSARNQQPGIAFQTFDDLAVLLLQQAQVDFTPITEEERVFLFLEILDHTMNFHSDKELVQQAKAYADTYGQLKRLGLTTEQIPHELTEFTPIFKEYESKYRDEQCLFDPENRIYLAIEHAKKLTTFPLSHVVIDGYIDFSPIQYTLIQYLQDASVPVSIYLPTLETKLITETRATLMNMGFHYNDEQTKNTPICKSKDLTAATTMEEEVHGVLERIDELRNGGSYDAFGIAFINENYLSEIERTSLAKQIPIKKARKKALDETLLYSFLHLVLKNNEVKTKWEQVPILDMTAKLCFVDPMKFNEIKEHFIANHEHCHDHVCTMMEQVVKVKRSLEDKQTIAGYNQLLLQFIGELPLLSIWKQLMEEKTAPNKLHQIAIEIRTFKRVKEVLENYVNQEQSLPIQQIEVQVETYQAWLLSILEREELYIDRAPIDGIELLPLREVALFNGKHLFVLGLNEGEFPKQMKLNGYVQERYLDKVNSLFPLPTASYFRMKDDATFAQLDYLAERISFSFIEGMNPNQPLLPSKYVTVQEIDVNEKTYSTIARLSNNSYITTNEFEEKAAYQSGIGKTVHQLPSDLKQWKENIEHVAKGIETVSSKWRDKLLSSRVSVTELEQYVACSFRYSLERILKMEEPLEPQTRIDPIVTGNMIHQIVENFYKDVKGVPFKDLTSLLGEKAEERLATIFEQAWKEVESKHAEVSQKVIAKAKQDWWKKIRRWLAAEKGRFWENQELAEMAIFQLEEPVELNLELSNNKTITLTGKIDRIDIDEYGFVIYDYKSSFKRLDFDNEIPDGFVLQIPLYMIALEHELTNGKFKNQALSHTKPIGGGYITIKEPDLRKKNTVWTEEHKHRFEPRYKTNVQQLDSETLKRTYSVTELIEKIWINTTTDFSVKPYHPSVCKYCSFKSICRVTTELQNTEEVEV